MITFIKNESPSILDEDMRVALMHNVAKNPRREEFFKKKVNYFQIKNYFLIYFISFSKKKKIAFLKQLLKNRIRTKASQTLQG